MANFGSLQKACRRRFTYSPREKPLSKQLYLVAPQERMIVNSVGEGGIMVINTNGNIENGDYITLSDHLGYGEKQDEIFLANYILLPGLDIMLLKQQQHFSVSGHAADPARQHPPVEYVYRRSHPLLQFLPQKLSEWIAIIMLRS